MIPGRREIVGQVLEHALIAVMDMGHLPVHRLAGTDHFAAERLGVSEIHFLPYHTLGMNKYTLLNLPYLAPDKPLDNPALLEFAQSYAHRKGLTAILRG